jgi:hypothetical protein
LSAIPDRAIKPDAAMSSAREIPNIQEHSEEAEEQKNKKNKR